MNTITVVSLMSDNHEPFYRGVAEHLARRTGLPIQFAADAPWQERERMLRDGRAQMGFVCGQVYAHESAWLELLAAPVMRDPRYNGLPVYFSDIVVRRGSRFRSFADLRGARWAYNEPGSWSGCRVLEAHLAAQGETAAFCGSVVESGAHLRSLALILDGAIDAAAIDSTVLSFELAREPELHSRIRCVASLGPTAHPPAVIRRDVPVGTTHQLRAALLDMHGDRAAATIFDGQYTRFAAVQDADYQAIRQKSRLAERARLTQAVGTVAV
ncbi:MAG TPA: PhnD/SsuA/transferrin family substrate-binding protein [Roseiflexaceae bacterium]|nr:PhnD/SsuA/transferrin family substrate-binding protein [Roseiflexaceae bacterium]